MTVALPPQADDAPYRRMARSLIASWEQYAAASSDGRVVRLNGAAAAVFPRRPEGDIYNNALLLGAAPEIDAVADAIECAYRQAGVARYAVWVHESDPAAADALRSRGYVHDASTCAMAMPLTDITPRPVDAWIGPGRLDELLRVNELPADLLPNLGGSARVYVARRGARCVAALMACDHDGDCGIYSLATLKAARRSGLGTALTIHALNEARERGCTTASLQSTPVAERVYAAIGFRSLGRIDEYVPGVPA